jgi:hypothetical protein
MSTILLKSSSTASSVPGSGDLSHGELAINTADQKLYSKDSGGTVFEVTSGSSANEIDGGSASTTYYSSDTSFDGGSA